MNWEERIGNLVCGILQMIYVKRRASFEAHARRRAASVEQLAAAAITQALLEDEALHGGVVYRVHRGT